MSPAAVFRFILFLGLTPLTLGQPLVRTAATSLRVPANAPATTYTTGRAFPSLSFTQPVALVSPPSDTKRLFVVEKGGRILEPVGQLRLELGQSNTVRPACGAPKRPRDVPGCDRQCV